MLLYDAPSLMHSYLRVFDLSDNGFRQLHRVHKKDAAPDKIELSAPPSGLPPLAMAEIDIARSTASPLLTTVLAPTRDTEGPRPLPTSEPALEGEAPKLSVYIASRLQKKLRETSAPKGDTA